MTVGAAIREKAREHDLNAVALDERGDDLAASLYAAIAIALYEVAEAFDRDPDDDT